MSAPIPTFKLNAKTDLPAVGYGTFLVPDDQAASAVYQAIKTGYRHIDTAEVYANEAGVGAGIRKALDELGLMRSDIFITTKLWPGYAQWGQEPKTNVQTKAAFHESLTALGVDYVDLYLIHSAHGGDRRLDQWGALTELKEAGLARSVGVSNFNTKHLEEIAAAGLETPDANQIELHPWSQKPDIVSYMAAKGILPIAYSSLAPLPGWRAGQESAKKPTDQQDDEIFTELARKHGVSEAQILLRWGVQSGYAVLPKSLNPERMRTNLDIFGFEIDGQDMGRLGSMDRGDGLAWSSGDPSQFT